MQLIEAAKVLRFDPATGWPEQFTVNQAIALQTWHEGIAPKAWGSKADDLRRLFALDHGKGNVKVTTTSRIEKRAWSKNIEVTFASMHWDGVPGKRRTVHGVKDVEVKTDHIKAEAFAAWLAANEIEPSRLIAAWFKAQAVNTDSLPIAPPAEWKAQSPHGLQRLDTTDAGRLVRLADLVQWLMDTRELPCKTAVEQVCSTLEQRPSAAAGWLCLLTESGYAKPVTNEDSFFWVADPLSFWETPPQVPDADKGMAGAIKHMREYWGQSPAPGTGKRMGQHVLDPLAIRIDAAHLLWGYGRRVEAIEQTQAAAPAALVVAAPAEKRRVLKKNALIAELERDWCTIDADLNEASRNGLSKAAHTAKGWDVEHAKEWADSRGKLRKTETGRAPPTNWIGPSSVHRVK